METFSALLALCAVNSPHKVQWRGALMFSLICVWINDLANNHESGDLRRHRAHYDVTVMLSYNACKNSMPPFERLNITHEMFRIIFPMWFNFIFKLWSCLDIHFQWSTNICSVMCDKIRRTLAEIYRIYASVNISLVQAETNIVVSDSEKGLLPVWRQTTIWTNLDPFSIGFDISLLANFGYAFASYF